MSLKRQVQAIRQRLFADEPDVCRCKMAWFEQSELRVDGHVSKPIGEPVWTSERTATMCPDCHKPTNVLHLQLVYQDFIL